MNKIIFAVIELLKASVYFVVVGRAVNKMNNIVFTVYELLKAFDTSLGLRFSYLVTY